LQRSSPLSSPARLPASFRETLTPSIKTYSKGESSVPWHWIFQTGIDKGFNGIFFVDRHKKVSRFIIRGVQGHGKIDRFILSQGANHGRNPAGRQGNPSVRDGQAAVGGDDPYSLQCVIVIFQRLSHSHYDDVLDILSARCVEAEHGNLIGYFGRQKISLETTLAGETEPAPHPASSLCGYTQCPVTLSRDKNAFDKIAVIQFEERFFNAVSRCLDFYNFKAAYLCEGTQSGSEIF